MRTLSQLGTIAVAGLCSIALTAATAVGSATAAAPANAARPSSTLSASLLDKPSAPRSLTATPADQAVDLAWQPPSRTGATPITGYQILQRVSGGEWAVVVATTGSTLTTWRITGLTNGTNYFFRIAAVNSMGVGTQTASEDATPRGLPAAPTPPVVVSHATSFAVTWQRPDENGAAIRGYHLEQELNGVGEWTTVDADAPTYGRTDIDELTPGATYRFRIAARNAAGVGSTSLPSAAVRAPTAPDAPTGIVVERGVTTADATMHWLPPASDGGAAITHYVVQRSKGGWFTVAVTARTTTVSVGSLDPTVMYHFRVAAVNRVGASRWTEYTSPATPPAQPDTPDSTGREAPDVASPEPTGVTARGNSIAVAWGALTIAPPAPNRVDDWRPATVRVEYRVAGTVEWLSAGLYSFSAHVARVPGLTKGSSYEFRLVGVGRPSVTQPRPSAPSQPFRFVTAPGRATKVAARRVGRQAQVSWVAPRDTGGSPVTHYLVQEKKSKKGWTKARKVPANSEKTSLRLAGSRGVKIRLAAVNAQGVGPFVAAMMSHGRAASSA